MVGKIHTKAKRMMVMQGKRGRNRASRPKTFKTEEAANKYASENSIKKYSLHHLSSEKIRIVEE